MKKDDTDSPTPHELELMKAADEAERDMDEDLGKRVPGRASSTVRNVFSLKVGAKELDELAEAAEAAGLSVGAFIRRAALQKARGQQGKALKRVRKQVQELAEAVKDL